MLHWTNNDGSDDDMVVEGTIPEIKEIAERERLIRGLDVEDNNMWNEEIR